MPSDDTPDLSGLPAVLLAGGAGTRLHELGALEAKPALPLGGRRLVDFAVAAALGAGLARVVAVLGHRPGTLARHLEDRWGEAAELSLVEAELRGTGAALAAGLKGREAPAALVLPADQIHALDLRGLLRAHRDGGAEATAADLGGRPGPVVLSGEALRQAAEAGDLWDDLLPRLGEAGRLALWTPPEGYLRDIDTLDDLREAALDLEQPRPPVPLPSDGAGAGPPREDRADLAIEAGGLRLTVPRFGARQPGRWTVLEDSVVLTGARVAPGARLSRCIVAPSAVVPAGLVAGEDPHEDARWFRVTPQGTTLITAPMLAARAAERMRAKLGGLQGLAIPGSR